MLPSVLLKQAADAAATEAISLNSWLEMAIQTALQQARLVAEEEELTEDPDGERLQSRIERIETKLELFNQLLSRMQRIEDRLDLLD
jgi:glutathione S-transferase